MPETKRFTNNKILISFLAALILLGLGWRTGNVRAGQPAESSSEMAPVSSGMNIPDNEAANPSPARLTNANCIMCHQYTKFRGVTEDALQVSLTVDIGTFSQSVHGKAGILCVSCHTTFTTYPHSDVEQVTCAECHEKKITVVAKLPHENRRIMQIQFSETCRNCHANEFSANSIHTAIAQSGQVNAPLCTDCHGGHDVQHPGDPPERVTLICSNCHTDVYSDFLASKHQSADPLKQTCANCHIPHVIQPAAAAPVATPQPTPIIESTNQTYLSLWNSTCTMCHTYPSLVGKARDETTVSLTVTDNELSESVHGKAGLGCAACHQSIKGYPHQDTEQVACSRCHGSADTTGEIVANIPFESSREVSIQLNEACRTCHEDEYKDSADSMHTKSLEAGNLQAPLCVDCHGSHAIKSPKGPRASISQSCARCHESVYTSFQSSVHGVAIEKNDSPDAPTCADCHGVHSVSGPRNANFRSQSVSTCTHCHQDAQMMSKYGVSAELFNPNMDNFHGVALNLFNQQGSDLASKTAVCYDCHGIHTIRKSDDPLSMVYSANLLKTCQKCHPDASNRFASIGPAHNKPASGGLSLLGWIERIYGLLIIAAFGLLLIYIVLDGRKRRAEKKESFQAAIMGK